MEANKIQEINDSVYKMELSGRWSVGLVTQYDNMWHVGVYHGFDRIEATQISRDIEQKELEAFCVRMANKVMSIHKHKVEEALKDVKDMTQCDICKEFDASYIAGEFLCGNCYFKSLSNNLQGEI